jgi:hypothetical protein
MSDAPVKIVVDLSKPKGQRESIIELTQDEIDEREVMATEAQAQRLVDEQAKADAEATRQSGLDKLIALGLTEAEALALVGA